MSNSQATDLAKRVAVIDGEISGLQGDRKAILAEAKSIGCNPALVARLAKLMRMEQKKREKVLDQHELFGTYLEEAGLK